MVLSKISLAKKVHTTSCTTSEEVDRMKAGVTHFQLLLLPEMADRRGH